MLTEFEASVLAAAKFRDPRPSSLRWCLALATIVIVALLVVLATPKSAAQTAVATADRAQPVIATAYDRAYVARDVQTSDADALATSTFFFGYLEFDWDTSALGPPPGFTPSPAESPDARVELARQ